jgi:putative membrane protein
MSLQSLPALNAILNATAAALLIRGYILIRAHRWTDHKRVMLMAFGVSVAFLISYLTYHYQVGSVSFQKTGAIRTVYFAVLISHTVLAAIVPFLAIISLRRAFQGEPTKSFHRHRAIARWTLPLWLYVSVTGVVVYLMLYWL